MIDLNFQKMVYELFFKLSIKIFEVQILFLQIESFNLGRLS